MAEHKDSLDMMVCKMEKKDKKNMDMMEYKKDTRDTMVCKIEMQ